MLRRIAAGAALVLAAGVLPAVALAGAEARRPPPTTRSTGRAARPDVAKARVTPSHYSAVAVDVAGVRPHCVPRRRPAGRRTALPGADPQRRHRAVRGAAHPDHGGRARRRAPGDRHLGRPVARPPRHHDRARRHPDGLPRLGARRRRAGRLVRRPGVQQARHHHPPLLLRGRRRENDAAGRSSSGRPPELGAAPDRPGRPRAAARSSAEGLPARADLRPVVRRRTSAPRTCSPRRSP